MIASQSGSPKSTIPGYFRELSEATTRDFFPDAGYSIRSLCQNHEGKKTNIFTVIRYEASKDRQHSGKWFETTPFPAEFEMAGNWLSLPEGNNIIEGLEDKREITISDGVSTFLGNTKQEYRWNPLEFVYGSNGQWYYGMEKPATLASFSTNGAFPTIECRFARRISSERLESYIWFNLVSDTKIRPTNCKRYTNPSVLLILPHYHGRIESVTVEDQGIVVRLASDTQSQSWKQFSVASKEYYHGGMESDLKSAAIDSAGTARLESSGSGLASVEVDLFYSPGSEDEGFWVDKTRQEKKRSRSNMSLEMHDFFDPESKSLEDRLLRPGTDAISFEWAVGTLLHLAGYKVEWVGFLGGHKGGGNEEIDLIASGADDEDILAVECTVARGDLNRKIQSIAAKSTNLTSRLSGAKVTPVVCISLGGEQLKAAGFERGQSGDVRILSGDDLSKLLEEIRAGVPHKSLAKKLSTHLYVI